MIEFQPDLSLPYLTAELPGIGGQLRATPEHFVVEEVPLYLPEGEGPHLYINLTKVGMTTKEVQRRLEQLVGGRSGAVGYAGLKDKHARTTQTFSINLEQTPPFDEAELGKRITETLPVTVNWLNRHRNKLRAGHLLGNRFTITISGLTLPAEEILSRVTAIQQRVQAVGLPNFFGVQRFGIDGMNVAKGRAILLGQHRERDRWLHRFLLSSYQSYLCNRYLAARLNMGAFERILPGDVAKKMDSGGMFDVTEPAVDQLRYAAHEISFTAPIYGPKMWAAQAEAGDLEAQILAEAGITLADFQRAKVDGGRRLGRLLLPDLQFQLGEADGALALEARFFLPKGAFATTVMRELMKSPANEPELPEMDSDE